MFAKTMRLETARTTRVRQSPATGLAVRHPLPLSESEHITGAERRRSNVQSDRQRLEKIV